MVDISELYTEGLNLTKNDRQKEHGDFHSNMELEGGIMEALFEAGLSKKGHAHNSCIRHVVHKLVRIAQGNLRRDNYVDTMNYIAQAYVSEVKSDPDWYDGKSHVYTGLKFREPTTPGGITEYKEEKEQNNAKT